ncbi:MAG TPA: hypothetical protein VM597_14640 [Gemmataceae bacterium]|nr:hypothetical protein [Gemmataceae bacterium]
MPKRKKTAAVPTGPTAPTGDVITHGMRERAQTLIADPDVIEFVRDMWRLHIEDSQSFECLGPVDLGCVKFMSGAAQLLEVIAGNEDA